MDHNALKNAVNRPKGGSGLREFVSLLIKPYSAARKTLGLERIKGSGFLRVLTYHAIPPEHLSAFEKQIAFACQRYRFVDMDTFSAMIEGSHPIEGGNLLLTFDDGFKCGRMVAERILKPLGLRAVFFVCVGFMDCEGRNSQKRFIAENIMDGTISTSQVKPHHSPMSWLDLKYLIEGGHSIGSHSYSHKRLVQNKALKREIVDSGDVLQERLGIPIELFAYPFGDVKSVDSQSLQMAVQRYKYVFSGVRGNNVFGHLRTAIRRDAVPLPCSLSYFSFILEGGLSAYYYLDRKRLDKMVA